MTLTVLEELEDLFLNHEEINLNDLPKYIDLKSLILGDVDIRIKDKENIIREYDHDKWGQLLKTFSNGVYSSFYEFRKMFTPLNEMNACFWNSKYYAISEIRFNDIQGQVMARIIYEYFSNENIVELGCGFGSMLLDIASQSEFKNTNFIGGELTNNGVKLTNKLAETFDLNVSAGYYDFNIEHNNEIDIPENSIIYTSFALTCLPKIEESILLRILSYNPKYVIHFEPVFTRKPQTIGDILINKYIIANNYNTNLSEVIEKMNDDNKIEILLRSNHLIGGNALLPASLMVWKPC